MTLLRLSPRSFLAILVCVVAGCAQTPPPPPPWENLPPIREDSIGRLQVDGANAFINGMHAANGAYVKDRDRVTTGPGTSARVILNPPGGIVQLDQNTDPDFILIKEGTCLLIKFAKGQGLLKNVKCVEAEGGDIAIVLKSLVNFKAAEHEAQVTVLEGHVDVTSPPNAAVGQFQRYTFVGGGGTLEQLTQEQANATAAWAMGYFRQPSVQQESGLSPAAFIAAAAAALGFFELFHHDSSSHSKQPSSPPPRTTTQPPATAPPPPAPPAAGTPANDPIR
jgi:hypothetical protein